jgi:hypothetical protein
MRQEIKRQKSQHRADFANFPAFPSQSEKAALWPESQLGGDGPWNNYGDDDREVATPITVDVPHPIDVTLDVPPITVDVPPHDFIPF